MKVNVIGAGPAGLYLGIMMKKADPAHDITVYERNRPDDTFGFGGVFSGFQARWIIVRPYIHGPIPQFRVIGLRGGHRATHITCGGVSRPLNGSGCFFALANDDGFGLIVTPQFHGHVLPTTRSRIGLASLPIDTPDIDWLA